jgi:hypothetical protein
VRQPQSVGHQSDPSDWWRISGRVRGLASGEVDRLTLARARSYGPRRLRQHTCRVSVAILPSRMALVLAQLWREALWRWPRRSPDRARRLVGSARLSAGPNELDTWTRLAFAQRTPRARPRVTRPSTALAAWSGHRNRDSRRSCANASAHACSGAFRLNRILWNHEDSRSFLFLCFVFRDLRSSWFAGARVFPHSLSF